jgi:deazaflavin-dependent oxidoreductase (nitroreductase family)
MAVWLPRFWRRVLRLPTGLFHLGLGRLFGHRLMLLIHVGHRTGLRRETVLEVLEYRPAGPAVVVLSGFGRHPDWLRNIEARPVEEVVVGGDHFAAVHRILGIDEAEAVVRRYEHRNRLIAPIVRFGLGWLLGTRYSGSDRDRRTLVERLPVIEFRPRS